ALQQEHRIETADLVKVNRRQRQTLGDLLERYERERLPLKRSVEVERYIVGWFKRHPIADLPLRLVSAEHFVRLRDERLRSVLPSTVRRQFTVLAHALKTA